MNIVAGGAAGRLLRRAAGLAVFLAGVFPAAGAPPAGTAAAYVPRANFVRVERSFTGRSAAPAAGAGVRAFQAPDDGRSGTERFEIRWYANPPGIPPGVILLLESIQEHSATVKNHSVRIDGKSEGHMRSTIEIPAAEIRQAGRIRKWRLRIIWRGRLLASQASADWEG
jgi:hypothetical protein